jgi:hypothetical protein
MQTSLACPSCRAAHPPGARFCTSCGGSLGGQSCTSCGAALSGGAFCTNCGTKVSAGRGPTPSTVEGGRWVRSPGEFVRRVDFDELRQQFDRDLHADGGFWRMLVNLGQQALQKLQNLYVTIPTGSVGVVIFDGVVTEILQPGRRAVSGFANALMQRLEETDGVQGSMWQRLRNAFAQGAGAAVESLLATRLQRTSVYLFDTRPIPIPCHLRTLGSSDDHALDVRLDVSAHIGGATEGERREAFGRFISRVVGDAVALDTQTMHRRLLPVVERLGKDAAERLRDANGPNLPKIQEYVRERVSAEVGTPNGLRFEVVAFTHAATLSLRLRLGQSQLPELRACVNADCAAEIKSGQRFCTGCGSVQPTVVDSGRACPACATPVPVGQPFCTGCGVAYTEVDPRAIRLLTADAEPIELDITLRAHGDRESRDIGRVTSALVAAARALLRGMTHAQATASEGMVALEKALAAGVAEALEQLNFQLLALHVLDIRGRNGEWKLNADAELRRARTELEVGREWLAVDGDRLTQQSATLDLVRQRLRLEQDDGFARASLAREVELRETLARLGHRLGLDTAALRDREQRQDLAAREATLDIADAQRLSQTALAVDEARRAASRAVRNREHEDAVSNFRQSAERDDLAENRRRTLELGEMGHQMELESRAADHDAARVRQAAGLERELKREDAVQGSELGRRQVDDVAYATQVGLDQAAQEEQRRLDRLYVEDQRRQDLSLGRQRSEQEILLDRQQAEQGLREKEARLAHELGEQAATSQLARDMEALRVAAAVQMERERLEMEREQARLKAEADREGQRLRLENDRLAGKTGADLLAAQAALLGDSANGAAFAAALAAQTDGTVRNQMLEQWMGRERQLSEESKSEMRRMFEQMTAMQQGQVQQNLVRESMDKDRTNLMFQQMMQMMAANTAALAGASRAAQEQTVDAHRTAAQQAKEMSERSMDTMAKVAATASQGPQQVYMGTPLGRSPAPQPPKVQAPAEFRADPPMPRASEAVAPALAAAELPPAPAAATDAGSCVSCAAPLDPPGSRFCGACGSQQD